MLIVTVGVAFGVAVVVVVNVGGVVGVFVGAVGALVLTPAGLDGAALWGA